MNKYQGKQFTIALIYLLILVVIIGGIYLIIRPKLDCSNRCGDPCPPCQQQLQKDLEIILAKTIKTQDDYVDLVAQVKNPNRDWGAKAFSYVFNLYDPQNSLVVSREGNSYVLPQETRYIIEQKVLINSDISKTELKIINVNWQELIDYQEPELIIRNPNLEQSKDFSKAVGTVENRSNYDFDKIDVWAVLFDKDSNILGGGKIELKTIMSKESRYFEISWLFPINSKIDRVDTVAKTNVFSDENFMRRHGGERKRFQEY